MNEEKEPKKSSSILRSKFVIVPLCMVIVAIVFSVIMLTRGAEPNPGHLWAEIGNGFWQSANTQTALRTFTFPDNNATVLTSSSSMPLLQVTIVASTTLSTSTNMSVFVNAASAPITVTLPPASGTDAGTVYQIKKIDTSYTHQVTIQAGAGDTIDGVTNISFANRGESAVLQSDGATWRVDLRRSYDYDAFHTRGASTTNQTQWYTSLALGTALVTTTALTVNKVYAMPLILTKVTTIDQMSIAVGSSTNGTVMEAGIYNDNGNEFPGSLAVDVGSQPQTANVSVTYTTNLPVTLDAGLYWMVVDSNGAVKLNQFPIANVIPLLGYSTTTSTGIQEGWISTLTAGALPATYPVTASATISATPFPAIFVHFSG